MLGDKILLYRRKEGFSQQQLADKLGITRQTVARWEKNINVPSDQEIKKLSELMDITEQELLLDDVTIVSDSETISNMEEIVNDISYGVSEQRKVLEKIAAKQVTSKDIEALYTPTDYGKEQLEVQKAILRQKRIRTAVLIILAIIIVILVGLLLFGIAFYSDENSKYTTIRPIEENQ